MRCLHLQKLMNWLKSLLHFLHVLKDAKPQARLALLSSASDELIKAIIECAINALHGNNKLSKDEKEKLGKWNNCFRALVNPKISFKNKSKILIQRSGFIVHLLTSILSGVIESVIINNST